MQIISVIKAQGTSHSRFYSVLYYIIVKNFVVSWPPNWIYVNQELSGMTDFHLVELLKNQNLVL